MKLEEVALTDEFFVERNLYPNVDFYSGIIYKAIGIPGKRLHGDVRSRQAARMDRPVARDAA